MLLIYPQSKDEDDTKTWGHNTKICEINSVQHDGDGKDVVVTGQGKHAFVKQPIQCSPAQLAKIVGWGLEFQTMHLQELGHMVEISNIN